jgi:class 3 adenylate cyclase
MAPSDSGSLEQGQGPEQGHKAVRRSLRAIFAADITGFSSAMSANETGAVYALNEVRGIAIRQLQAHDGWLFGMPGDGVFALFESAVSAVRCALDTQQQLASRPESKEMLLRIGIHLGDVLFENDLPFGEALTIAARLEALADPGGILVSGAVMDAVSARISATFEERGVPRLKNIPRRVVTYAVTPPPERTKADETRVGLSILDRTTQFDPDTFRSVRDQQSAGQTAERTAQNANEAVVRDEQDGAQPEAVIGNATPASQETSPRTEDLAGAPTPPNGAAKTDAAPQPAQPPEDTGKRAGHETPERRPEQVPTPPDRPAPVSEAASQSGSSAEPAGYRPSAECIESLTAALAVHLGPFAKVLVNRCLKGASSTEQLVALLEEQIPSGEERFLFRIRASHICMTFSGRQTDES